MKQVVCMALGVGVLGGLVHRLSAQQPSAAQVQQALAQQPGLADVLRQRIAQSGLTPEQIRSRLAAGGYPSTLLDAYLGAAQSGQVQPAPGALELQAVQALGLPLADQVLLPVVASSAGGLKEVAGDAAMIVEGRDPVSYVEALEELSSDSDERDVLIERGRRRAKTFSWQRTALETAGVYRELI